MKEVERKNCKLSSLVRGKFSSSNFKNEVARCHVSFRIALILNSNGLELTHTKTTGRQEKIASSSRKLAILYIPGSGKVHVAYSYRRLKK